MSGAAKQKSFTAQEKQEILRKYDELPPMSGRNAASILGIADATLRRMLKNRAQLDAIDSYSKNRKRQRRGKYEEVEVALKLWFTTARATNTLISGPILRQKAEELARKMGNDSFKATGGWFDRWKKRENILYKKTQGDQADADITVANSWIQDEWPKLCESFAPEDIYNADETGLYFRALPEHTLFFKEGSIKGATDPEERVTLLCCVSMTGEKRKLLAIGYSKKPPCFEGVKKLPVQYEGNANAWMTVPIFKKWLESWDVELKLQQRRILLLVDDCSTHSSGVSLPNIRVVFLPANSTAILQPCELGIVKALKVHYRHAMRRKVIQEIDDATSMMTANDVAKKIDLLDALHMMAKSWEQVSTETVKNCFRLGGFSTARSDPIEFLEVTLDEDLEQPSGMATEQFQEWLDVDDNAPTSAQMTDEEIISMVKKHGDEDDEQTVQQADDQDKVSEPTPSAKEMRTHLRMLRIGLERRGFSDFKLFYEFERAVDSVLNVNLQKQNK